VKIQPLTGEWNFRESGSQDWLPTQVPGDIHTSLIKLGKIPDPFIADNELQVMWVAEKDWEYLYKFYPEQDLLAEQKVFLVAEGLDTIGGVRLNGRELGSVNNQFRKWSWEIKNLLLPGENTLEITFKGPAAYAALQQERRRMKGVSQAIEGGPHLRKAPCQFGWDWGPMLPAIGIWKDIRIEGRSSASIDDILFYQDHKAATVNLQIQTNIVRWQEGDLYLETKVTSPNGEIIQMESLLKGDSQLQDIQLTTPYLWWPNGYGAQDLYRVKIKLKDDEKILDHREYKIGLRTIRLKREQDEFGISFQFVVNGVPIFVKGSNWIPADTFLPRFNDTRLERLIHDAALSHQNMLRVWGGGIYEEERFYDLCDKYGILVWQDFIFSCSIYPLDEPEFYENVRVEIEDNIKRLRHRASLALWCGNNEMEWGWESWDWQKYPMEDQLSELVEQFPQLDFLLNMAEGRDLLPDWEVLKQAYDTFFHQTLPEWVAQLDPDTPYWPSSPSSNTPFENANGDQQGDAHYWEVWHGRKPFTAYRKSLPRFMSEFGFQALPTMETIKFYASPEDRNLTSYIMEHHQRGNHGNGLIIAQMTDMFRMPKDFAAWIYLSLILQAEGIRYGVEHWRRNMDRVSGTLYWQLNDCWPVASWSSIDYFGRWKALHYAAKKFFHPKLLSVEDKPPVMDIHITNDLTQSWDGEVKWRLESLDGLVYDSGIIQIKVEPLSNNFICSKNFSDQVTANNERQTVFICELWQEETFISRCTNTFVPNKHVAYEDPELTWSMKQDGDFLKVSILAIKLARFVEVKIRGVDIVFSDNYFDIPADQTVDITCPIPDGMTLEDMKTNFQLYSLYDSF
jgi:beta-mannosidase